MYRPRSLPLVNPDSRSNVGLLPLCLGILIPHCDNQRLMEALVLYEGASRGAGSHLNMKRPEQKCGILALEAC